MKIIPSQKLLDSLKCPICKFKLFNLKAKRRRYINSYYICSKDKIITNLMYNNHYTVVFKHDTGYPLFSTETITIFHLDNKFCITKKYDILNPTKMQTKLLICKISPDVMISLDSPNKEFIFYENLFDFSKFELTKFISKINTILIFN